MFVVQFDDGPLRSYLGRTAILQNFRLVKQLSNSDNYDLALDTMIGKIQHLAFNVDSLERIGKLMREDENFRKIFSGLAATHFLNRMRYAVLLDISNLLDKTDSALSVFFLRKRLVDTGAATKKETQPFLIFTEALTNNRETYYLIGLNVS